MFCKQRTFHLQWPIIEVLRLALTTGADPVLSVVNSAGAKILSHYKLSFIAMSFHNLNYIVDIINTG